MIRDIICEYPEFTEKEYLGHYSSSFNLSYRDCNVYNRTIIWGNSI